MDVDEMTHGVKLFSIRVPFFLKNQGRLPFIHQLHCPVQGGTNRLLQNAHPYLKSTLMTDPVHVFDISDKHSFVIN